MRTLIGLTYDDIKNELRLISETYKRGSNPTQTFRGKRIFAEIFANDNIDMVNDVLKRVRQFTHKQNELQLTPTELSIFYKLVDYCKRL